jgi:hypothetical protein
MVFLERMPYVGKRDQQRKCHDRISLGDTQQSLLMELAS